jgi:hypothetical protein
MNRSPMTPAEHAAREELSGMEVRALTDGEWAEMRTNLLTVFGVLVEWQCADEDVRREENSALARR